MSYRYRVSYDVQREDPPVAKESLEARERSGADAIVFLSLLYPPDGSFSMLLVSLDGRTGDKLSDDEIFKCWALLSKRLSESSTLHENKKELARTLWSVWAGAVRRGG